MTTEWEKLERTNLDRSFMITAFCTICGPIFGYLALFASMAGRSKIQAPPLSDLIAGLLELLPGAYLFGGLQAFLVGVCFSVSFVRSTSIAWWLPLVAGCSANLIFYLIVGLLTEENPANAVYGTWLLVTGLCVFAAYACWAIILLVTRPSKT